MLLFESKNEEFIFSEMNEAFLQQGKQIFKEFA